MNKSILFLLLFEFCFAKTTIDFASKCDEVYHLIDDKYRVEKNNSYRMVNSKNVVLIPIKYKLIYNFRVNNDYYEITRGRKKDLWINLEIK